MQQPSNVSRSCLLGACLALALLVVLQQPSSLLEGRSHRPLSRQLQAVAGHASHAHGSRLVSSRHVSSNASIAHLQLPVVSPAAHSCSVHGAAFTPQPQFQSGLLRSATPNPSLMCARGACQYCHLRRSTSTVTVRCGRMTACARTGPAVCVSVVRMRCPCLGWQRKPSPARPHRALTAIARDVSIHWVWGLGVGLRVQEGTAGFRS